MEIIERVHNVKTGEIIESQREETAAEKKEREIFQKELLAREALAETKATSKAALLAKLGISEDEAKLLLS